MTAIEETKARLLAKRRIDSSTGCWIWTGWITQEGYGRTTVNGINVQVGRLALALWRGAPLAESELLGFTCNNAACFNPEHLQTRTKSEVVRNAVLSGRHAESRKTSCVHGHAFTAENTYVDPRGWRHCRTCVTAYQEAHKLRNPPTRKPSGRPFVPGDPRINLSGKRHPNGVSAPTNAERTLGGKPDEAIGSGCSDRQLVRIGESACPTPSA